MTIGKNCSDCNLFLDIAATFKITYRMQSESYSFVCEIINVWNINCAPAYRLFSTEKWMFRRNSRSAKTKRAAI